MIEYAALAVVAALGLVFGSFGNVVIWRLPRGESVSFPGSHCPGCNAPIAWYDNVPVLSWLVLRGRCRSCANPISVRYPLVELLSGVLWVSAALRFGMSVATVFAIVFFYVLLLLAFIDLDTMRLPNVLVAILGVAGLVGVLWSQFAGTVAMPLIGVSGGWLGSPLGAAAGGVVVGAGFSLTVSVGYSVILKRSGLGMGDVKLLAAMGLFLGPYVLITLFLGSLFGTVYALARGIVSGRAKIPFGPFLALGAVITVLAGPELLTWYLTIL